MGTTMQSLLLGVYYLLCINVMEKAGIGVLDLCKSPLSTQARNWRVELAYCTPSTNPLFRQHS